MLRAMRAGSHPRGVYKVFRVAGLGALCLSALASSVRAQWTPRVETRAASPGAALPPGELVVNGVMVVRLRTELGGLLPEQRVEVAAERLRVAVAAGLKPADVQVDTATDRANPRLKALGQVVAVATKEEAKAAGASALGLAQSWAGALRKALGMPGLSVSAGQLLVPLGEARVLKVGGAARGPLTVTTASGEAKAITIAVDPATSDVTIQGAAAGRETLTLAREGATATVSVAVQPYAGRIEMPRPVVVTGASVPAELIARHVTGSALAAARVTPGATAQIAAKTVNVAPLAAGQSQTVDVPLLLSGPDMIPVRGVARVAATGQTLPRAGTAALHYSNNPERVTRFGTLFVARLAGSAGATRLLYHHQSAMDRAAWFTVELINDADRPATVQVVGGAAGPVLDTVWVGYRAGSMFFKDVLSDTGALVQVPARSRVALTAQRLAPGLTISGLVRLRPVTGDPLLVRVAADIPGDARTAKAELVPIPLGGTEGGTPLAFTLSDHVYPEPSKSLKETYQVGGRWAFVSIGRVPIKGADEARRLEGNYGVFYDIELTLENPTASPATIHLTFEPSAGMAGGVFLIDGRMVELPQAQMPAEVTLARYALEPGAKQTVQVKTFPLSGSAYPARLIVRP